MKFSGNAFNVSSFWVLGKIKRNRWEPEIMKVSHGGTPDLSGKPYTSLRSLFRMRQTLQECWVFEQTDRTNSAANPWPPQTRIFRTSTQTDPTRSQPGVLVKVCKMTSKQPTLQGDLEVFSPLLWSRLSEVRNRERQGNEKVHHTLLAEANPFL